MSGNVTATGNSTASGNMTSSTSTTPTTFPIATVPTTGYLAGTAAVPVPGGASGATGSNAAGPDDSHIVSAAQVLRASFAAVSASLLALGVGVYVLL
ncbi:hypothetical protein NDA16_003880 [Ustilago loliicola]|nr:hypothetical protein NDA16_003880 [Ustilago loliicola]